MSDDKIKYENIKKFFKNLTHYIIVLNKTSQTQILYPNPIKIENFEETQLALKMPKRSCSDGHLLNLFITNQPEIFQALRKIPEDENIPGAIKIKGKVTSVVELDQDFYEVLVQFIDFSIDEWHKFLELHSERHKLINHILGEMKK